MGVIKDLIRWATVTNSSLDTEKFAVQQLSYLSKTVDSLMVFPYGTHANVPEGAFALTFSIQGNPENRACIAWTPNTRPVLAAGEVAFYHPPTSAFIIWRANGDLDIQTGDTGAANINVVANDINVTASNIITMTAKDVVLNSETTAINATTSCTITTPSFTVDAAVSDFTGTVNVAGDVVADGDVTAGSVTLQTHVHDQGVDSDGDSQVDTGVAK